MKQTRLGKRIAAWLLCLAMVMTAINLPAFTTEAKAEEISYVTVTSWAELQAGIEAEGTDARYFKLGNDITASETDTYISVGRAYKSGEDWEEYFADLKKITIDLNGHTLDRGLADSEPEEGGSHFFVWDNASLSLVDNSGTKAGKITGANNIAKFSYDDYSPNILAGAINNGGTLLLRDITITGNKTTGYGGGIFSFDAGRVKNILSGKVIITGNLASEANGRSYIASDIHFQNNRTEVMNFDNMTTTGEDKSQIGIRLYNPQPGDAFLLCEYNDSLAQVGDCIEIENAIEDAELSVKILDGAKKYLAIASCVHEYEYYDTSYDKCKLCGYMVTHLNIAGTNKCRYCGVCVNYRYHGDHNWVNDASWHDDAENNSHYRFCNDCKENIYEDHIVDSQDDNYHKCSVCGSVQEHAFKIVDEASGSKQCEVCGYSNITFDESHKSVAIAGITYTKVEDGVTVKASDNSLAGDLVIPYEIVTASRVLKIVSVEENGFSSCKGLTSVGISNGVAYNKTDFPEGVAINVYETDTSNFSFELDNGKLGVSAASIYITGEIVIPSYVLYGGKVLPVEHVALKGFKNCNKVTKIVLPDTVTVIKNMAFNGCAELSSIYFSKSVEQIGYSIFTNCKNLINITVDSENSVFQMQEECLIDQTSNTLITATNNAISEGKLVIPNGIEVIYGAAFFGREGFTEVEIPTTVRIIGDCAFAYTDLIKVDIPFGVEEICIDAFRGCDNLTSAILPSSLKRVNYQLYSTEAGCIFIDCPNFTEKLNVPCSVNSIYEIGSSGFIGDRFDQIVVVPDSYADNYYKQRGWTGYARTGTHDYTDQPWLVDADGKHYQVCRGCGVESEHADHTFVSDAENNNHKCSVCGTTQSHAFSENAKDVKIDGNKHGKECTICHGVIVTGNHDFYAEDGTCKTDAAACESCGVKNIAYKDLDVSISTPIYSGTAQKPTVVIKDGETTLVEGADKDYTVTVTEQTAASDGTYDITVTGVGNYAGSFEKKWSIAKTDPTESNLTYTAPDPDALTYDGTAKEATVVAKDGLTGFGAVTVKYQEKNTAEMTDTAPTDAGVYDVYADIAEGVNYNAKVVKVGTFEIAKAASSVTTAPVAKADLEYQRGTDIALLDDSAVEVSGGTIVYRLGETGEFTATIPTVTNAGDYKVYYKVKGDGNHTDTDPVAIDVSVAKITPTYEAPTNLTAKCGQKLSDITLPDGFVWTSEDVVLNADSDSDSTEMQKTAKYSPEDSVNYSEAEGIELIITVTHDYEGQPYVADEDGIYHYQECKGCRAHSALGNHDFSNSPNICDPTKSECSLCHIKNIAYSGLDITITNPKYIGSNVTPTVVVKDGTTTLIKDVDYTLTVTAQTDIAADGYDIKISGIGSYAGYINKTWNIDKATPTAALLSYTAPSNLVYNNETGKVATVTSEATGLGDITVKYVVENGSESDLTTTAPKNVGNYDVYAVIAEGLNYTAETIKVGTFTISPADSSISINSASINKTYGDAAFSVGATRTGDGTLTYTSADTSIVEVSSNGIATIVGDGTTTITVAMAATTNYKAAESKTITITVAKATAIEGIDYELPTDIEAECKMQLKDIKLPAGFSWTTETQEVLGGDLEAGQVIDCNAVFKKNHYIDKLLTISVKVTHKLKVDQLTGNAGTEKHASVCSECNKAFNETPCSGGEATCSKKAVCAVCEREYGSLNPTKHKFTTYTSDNDATCLADGHESAACDYGCIETDTRLANNTRLGHEYEASFEWQEDGSACYITLTCKRSGCHESTEGHSVRAACTVTSAVKTAPTCVTKGTTIYTAKHESYTDTKDIDDIEATGQHDFSNNGTCVCGLTKAEDEMITKVDDVAEILKADISDIGIEITDLSLAEYLDEWIDYTSFREYISDGKEKSLEWSYDSDKYEWTFVFNSGEGKDSVSIQDGKVVKVAVEEGLVFTHKFDEEGVCTDADCKYECTHEDQNGSAFVNGVCSICNYNCVTKGHVKNTNDWSYKNAAEHEVICSVCNEIVKTKNHDFSKQPYQVDEDGKHYQKCKDCGAESTHEAHTGGTATCKVKAKCTVCGEEYGSLAAHTYATKWSTDDTNHWHACTVCGAKKDNAAHTDSDKNEKCDTCDYNMHSHSGTKVAQVDATCSSYGVKAYYKCSCGKYYTDSECTKEITDLEAWKSGDGRIEKKEHTLKTTTTKATLTANGKKETKCSVCGKVTKTETIYAAKTIKLSATKYTYDGKVKKPSVTIKDSKGNAIASTNYTVTYPSGRKNVGKYTVKVTFKGNYSGSKNLTFTINPPKTSISKVTAGKKAFTVKWAKKTTQVTGYEIQYSTSSSFAKGNKTVKVTSAKTVSKTISKLTGGKKYYVRIRTYKTVGKTPYYSDWSAKKSVTTKK